MVLLQERDSGMGLRPSVPPAAARCCWALQERDSGMGLRHDPLTQVNHNLAHLLQERDSGMGLRHRVSWGRILGVLLQERDSGMGLRLNANVMNVHGLVNPFLQERDSGMGLRQIHLDQRLFDKFPAGEGFRDGIETPDLPPHFARQDLPAGEGFRDGIETNGGPPGGFLNVLRPAGEGFRDGIETLPPTTPVQ